MQPPPRTGPAGPSPTAIAIATFPADYYSTGHACGGIGYEALRISVDPSGRATGVPVSPAAPGEARGATFSLVWPQGYRAELNHERPEIVSADGALTIRDGTVLAGVGACPQAGALFISDPGKVLVP